jgi:hypothetical protein
LTFKDWSYTAKNLNYKAIRDGGFNKSSFPQLQDVIVTTEPEAAASYTARYLKESLGRQFLKVNPQPD